MGPWDLIDKSEGTVHARDLDSWREGLLRVVLTAAGFAIVSSWLALWCSGHVEIARTFEYLLLIGGLLPLLGSFVSRHPRTASWGFVLSQFVPLSHAILSYGWAPATVVWLIFLTLFSGLLIGRPATFGVVGGVSVVFCLGGLIADGRLRLNVFPPLQAVPPALDSHILSNWVAATLIFACFTAASGWGLGRLLGLLSMSTAHYTSQVNLLHERHALLSAVRSERGEKTRQLQEAQRFQMITQLGRGFYQLFGETLSSVRKLSQGERPSPDSLRVIGEQIIDLVQRSASRSQDVLALLRSHSEPKSTVSLSHSLTAIAYRFRAQLGTSIVLDVDAPVNDHAGVEEAWLEQVLLNLLLNAQHALANTGGRILVQVRRLELTTPCPSSCGTLPAGAYAVVRVTDNGPGIGAESASRVFEPFYSEWGHPHVGIGLTTVFEMSRKAGGSVEIESPAVGASVAVYIPLARVVYAAPASTRFITTVPRAMEWQQLALRKGATHAATCTTIAMIAAEVQRWVVPKGMMQHITIGLPLLGVFAFIARGRASYLQNLSLFIAAVYLASLLFLANLGFMAPAGIAGLTLATLLTRVLDSPRIASVCLAVAVVGLLGVGLLHSRLGLDTPGNQTSLALAGNWYRVAVSVPCIALIGALAVLQVVEAARSSIAQLVNLQESLTSTEQQLIQEVQSVSNIDRITARASDLEALGRMTGAVAHDVNNSLQAITAWASTLLADGSTSVSGAHLEALAAINQAVDHAEALLADLDVSRLGPPERAVVDVGSETQRVSRLLRALLGSRHQLKILAPKAAPVIVNAHTFHRALFNLVANARDAMASPGTCTVSVNCTAAQVSVRVEDDGDGMDELTRQRLFEAYFTTKGTRGNGLGLCSVTKLLSESNGSVETWSQLGRGTRITLTLPKA